MDKSEVDELMTMSVTQVQWCSAPWHDKRTNTRITNALRRNGINTIAQLVTYSRTDLIHRDGIGDICLRLIVNKLHKMGLKLK